MKITSVSINDFKGGNCAVPLTGVDILTGENGMGKTRIIQAIQLALFGSVPKTNEEKNIDLMTMFSKYNNSQSMGVTLNFSEGNINQIERRFVISSKGGNDTVSQKIMLLPFANITGVKACEEKIEQEIGSFPYMVNVIDFIRLSNESRMELLFKFCPVDTRKYNVETILDRLCASIKDQYTGKDNPKAFKLVNTLNMTFTPDIQGSIVNLLAFLKKEESEAKREERQFKSAGLGTLKLDEKDGKTSLRIADDIKSDIQQSQKEYDQLFADVYRARMNRKAALNLNQEKESLRQRIETERQLTGTDAIQKIEQEILKLRGSIQSTTESDSNVDKIKSNIEELNLELSELKQGRADVESKFNQLKIQQKALSNGVCPTCGQESSGLLGDIEESIQKAGEAIAEYNSAINKVEIKLTEANASLAEEKRVNLQIAINNNTANGKANALESQLNTLKGRNEGIAVLEKRLQELEQTTIDGYTLDIAEGELNLQGIKSRIDSLSNELEEKIKYDSKVQLTLESTMRAKQSETLVSIIQTLIEEVQTMRREIVKSALEPIESEARELLATIFPDVDFAFQFTDQRGNDVFKFGWMVNADFNGKVFVDFDSLSTAQQIFTLVAILAPLIHRGSPRLRILLLDNCEVIHELYRSRFTQLMLQAHGRFLDNFIIASSSAYNAKSGVNVIQLTNVAGAN